MDYRDVLALLAHKEKMGRGAILNHGMQEAQAPTPRRGRLVIR
ncbi:MAG: hypothetical protein AVDCRST_MAG93-3561 [uncultured Chloroflexia bacterium]|uniref:Uncharacterized protein n=1 Tax=uncultured Chloroflexia bacterium TaxID=1672391 RepID=A0A6J4JSV8_9CHLR|nr:MAG: hypothetical protein AVDCRST_MAG93-3561 [uncultured Chloroflexia bacterium]